VSEVVFDTGALVRLQREGGTLRNLIETAREEEVSLVVSAATLTEFLGGSPRRQRGAADWIASHFETAAVTEAVARRGATLMRLARDASRSASPGPIDALAATEGERRGAHVVVSGDRADFDALAAASGRFRVIDLDALL